MSNTTVKDYAILLPLTFTDQEIARLDINAFHGLRSMEPNLLDKIRPYIRKVSPLMKTSQYTVRLPYTFKLICILNLDILLAAGTKPIDAALFLNIGIAHRLKYFDVKMQLLAPGAMPYPPISKRQIGMDVFVLYVLLFCYGTLPSNDPQHPYYNYKLPRGIRQAFPEYEDVTKNMLADRLSSFDLAKINHDWIKKVDTSHCTTLDQQHSMLYTLRNYRLLRCFVEYTVRSDADADVKRVYDIVETFIMRGYTWDCHPVTRTTAFKKALPNFDQSLYELIFMAFTEDQISRMRYRRYILPTMKETKENSWRKWTQNTFESFKDYIFPHQAKK
jgi:hypothetical protein